jgi:membrane-bound serine protease (ClpP class)
VLRRALRLVVAFVAIGALPVAGQSEATIEVVQLSGPLDSRLIDFAVTSIEAAADGDVEVVILQIDSPGSVAGVGDLRRLADVVSHPPVPVVAWVGPAPAVALGGVAQVMVLAPLRAAAPGAEIGWWTPTVAGDDDSGLIAEPPLPSVTDATLSIDAPVPGLVDLVRPETASHRQLAQVLDGMEVSGVTLHTVQPYTTDDGEEGVTLLPTVIRQPGLWDRFLRLASTPEAAFFFLVIGLTVAVFEYFAIGPGIAAAVAAVSLVVAGYGLAVLPVRWWAFGLVLAATAGMAIAYQLGGSPALTIFGLVALTVAGLGFTDTAPQFGPGVGGVVLTVAAAAFFFLIAMPTVARSRFSTQTIGREGLVGRSGVALSALTPDGEVVIDGARWRATSHREAGIGEGDPIEVTGIEGWFVEVAPTRERENPR